MPTDPMLETIHHFRALLLRQVATDGQLGMTDGQLLESFIKHREHTGLEALMARHSAMVWGVCRRILHNHHDAEDAFQATFLVLIRKAESIMPREMVGNWLYGVAYQTAMNAKALAAKRKVRERQGNDMPEPAAPHDLSNELQSLLDLELSRLPDRYRAVVVLCDLEGKTRQEVVRQLGVPDGTIAGRLSRARTMLAKRLARHGVVLSSTALASALAEQGAMASVPAALLNSTIKAAGQFAAGQTVAGIFSPNVLAITRVVMKGMLLAKLKLKAMALTLMSFMICGAALVTFRQWPSSDGQYEPQKPSGELVALQQDNVPADVGQRDEVKNPPTDVRPKVNSVTEMPASKPVPNMDCWDLIDKALKAENEKRLAAGPIDADRRKIANHGFTLSIAYERPDGQFQVFFIMTFKGIGIPHLSRPGKDSMDLDDDDETIDLQLDPYIKMVMDLFALKDHSNEIGLSFLGESKIGDKSVLGVAVTSKGHPDVKLFFEKDSFLLLKAEYRDEKGNHTVEIDSQDKKVAMPNFAPHPHQELPGLGPRMAPSIPRIPAVLQPFLPSGLEEILRMLARHKQFPAHDHR